MPDEEETSCVEPARGPIVPEEQDNKETAVAKKEENKVLARVGQKAPDFEAMAYVDGGFKLVRLSDYAGKWVTLCFYPGDFTFV